MKIQEMKSGILHLAKKMDDDRHDNPFEMFVIDPEMPVPVAAHQSLPQCEVDQPRWSVISFKRREAGSLTYAQAAARMSQLDSQGLSGLCIVTDKAALRITDQKSRITFP